MGVGGGGNTCYLKEIYENIYHENLDLSKFVLFPFRTNSVQHKTGV